MRNPVPECCLAVAAEPPDRLDPGFELFFELRALDRRDEFLFEGEFLVTIDSIGPSERALDLVDRLDEPTVVSVSSAFDLYSGGRISFGIVILPISGVFSPSFRVDLSVFGGSDLVRLVKADRQRRVFRGKRIL